MSCVNGVRVVRCRAKTDSLQPYIVHLVGVSIRYYDNARYITHKAYVLLCYADSVYRII